MEQEVFDIYEGVNDNFWYFNTRNELIHRLLNKYCRQKGRVLDCGCGTGLNNSAVKDARSVISMDISERALMICKKKKINNLVQANAQSLPFADKSFDAIVAIELLEHLDEDNTALKEFSRVLKPGGIAVITTPAFPYLWSDIDILGQHKRRYTRKELRHKVKNAGFRIEFISYRHFFLFLPSVAYFMFKNIRRKLFRANPTLKLETSMDNPIMKQAGRMETFFISKGIRFPFGLNLVCILRKPLHSLVP